MDKITTIGVRITRKCSLRCSYCNIPSVKKGELSYEQWIDIFKNLQKRFNVNEVTLLGGEPTLYSDIVPLVDYLQNSLNYKCKITTNAFNNYDVIKKLSNVGLDTIGFSVDNLDFSKSISTLKCKLGFEMINKIISNKLIFNNIVDYVVLNYNNLESIFSLIEYMDSKNVKTYILPFHHSNEGDYEHRKNNLKYAITADNYEKYCNTIDKIIEMKKNGSLILNSIDFLKQTKANILNLNWHCNGLSELRIDSDGKLMCCCDFAGSTNEKFGVNDLFNDNYKEFLNCRRIDCKNCTGCLWPSSYESQRKRDLEC